MTSADITPLDQYEYDVEQHYIAHLAKQKAAYEEIINDLKKEISAYEKEFTTLIPYNTRAFLLLTSADECMGDLSLEGPTSEFTTQLLIRQWLREYYAYVEKKVKGDPDGQSTDD